MKRIMLVGKSFAGKSTLCQYLNNQELNYKKTQSVEVFCDTMIDTPGEYLENRFYYKALQVTSVEADVIVFVQDVTDDASIFPPNFAFMFSKPVIGVVTKSDQKVDDKQQENAIEVLKVAGVLQVFVTSSVNGTGFEELIEYLED